MRARAEKFDFDDKVLSMLACPACHGELRAEVERLACCGCGRRYPVVDGIPVLIAERAQSEGDEPAG